MGKIVIAFSFLFLPSPHGHWQVGPRSLSFPAGFQLLIVEEKGRAEHVPGKEMGLRFPCDIDIVLGQQRVPTYASMLSKTFIIWTWWIILPYHMLISFE